MTKNTRFELIWETDEMCNVFDNDVVSTLSVEEVCDLLNEYDRRCNRWVSENNRLKKEIILIEKRADKVYNENEQLKQRNNRQYEQLGRLYNLIEQKDWRALNDILDDFKRCEEQLQKEWGTYGDVE